MLHKVIVTVTAFLIVCSATAELLFPSKLLAFVSINSDQQTNFLLRTTAVALLAILPGLWSARQETNSLASRNALLGVSEYMLFSSLIDYQAFTQGIVNATAIPSIGLRLLWGLIVLWLTFRVNSK